MGLFHRSTISLRFLIYCEKWSIKYVAMFLIVYNHFNIVILLSLSALKKSHLYVLDSASCFIFTDLFHYYNMRIHKIWTFTHTFLKFRGCIQNSRIFIPPPHTSSIVCLSFQDALCFSEVFNIISHHSTSISSLMYNSPLSYKISCGCP